jgi:hypothetical protein
MYISYSALTASTVIVATNLFYRSIVHLYTKKLRFISLSLRNKTQLVLNTLFFSITSFFAPYLTHKPAYSIPILLCSHAYL